MRLLTMIILTVVGFFQMVFLPPAPEQTEWISNGTYVGFFYGSNPEEKTMNQLMELAEAEDAGGIYEVFSEQARKDGGDLQTQVLELIRFLDEEVTSWETDGANHSRRSGLVERSMFFLLHTEDGTYTCRIRDKMGTGKGALYGFFNISIYPEELYTEYAVWLREEPGIQIVYRLDGEDEASLEASETMEALMELAAAEDMEGFYGLFSPVVREEADGLRERIPELARFLREEVADWEPYAQFRTEERHFSYSGEKREVFFQLHTGHGTYRCDIRAVTEDPYVERNLGLYSISIFPALGDGEELHENEPYETYCVLGREEAGIFLAE